jgi:hypothetical protein
MVNMLGCCILDVDSCDAATSLSLNERRYRAIYEVHLLVIIVLLTARLCALLDLSCADRGSADTIVSLCTCLWSRINTATAPNEAKMRPFSCYLIYGKSMAGNSLGSWEVSSWPVHFVWYTHHQRASQPRR